MALLGYGLLTVVLAGGATGVVPGLGAERLAPLLAVTSHVDQQILASRSIVLAGTATDAGRGGSGIVSVKVNGVRARGDAVAGGETARWSRELPLVPGWNKVSVVAVDGRTNSTTNSLRILSDTVAPVVAVTSPGPGTRLNSPDPTISGTASDAQGLAEVRVRMNDAEWRPAVPGPGGWVRWTAPMILQAGLNTLRVYAVDIAGNRSTTNTVAFTHVVSAPLVVATHGVGTVSPNLNGQRLEVGKSYTLTATGQGGFTFTNWTSNQGLVTNRASLSFTMRSNLVLTASFVDTTRPTVTITSPTSNQRVNDGRWTVRGGATDNAGVARAMVRLNAGAWVPVMGGGAWSRDVVLEPGANQVWAYAEDARGNRSTTNSVVFTYVVSGPLVVVTNGVGTVSPNLTGQRLELGKTYTVTAVGQGGFTFTNWTSNQGLVTNRASLTFTMRSNLVLTARFVDLQRPTLQVTAPLNGSRSATGTVVAGGVASDNDGISEVRWRVNGDSWQTAVGTTRWTASISLATGVNAVSFCALDRSGNRSATNTLTITHVKDVVPSYWPMNDGDRKVYQGPLGAATLSFASRGQGFTMDLWTDEDSTTSFYEYSTDRSQLLLTGGQQGWNKLYFEPKVVELTSDMLLDGGSRTSTGRISMRGQSFPVTVSVRVTPAGVVQVPVGRFENCRRVDVTVKVQGEGPGSLEAYILAPRVGMVRIGAYQLSPSGATFLGWHDLVSGRVNGVDVTRLSGSASGLAALAGGRGGSPGLRPVLTLESLDPGSGRFGIRVVGDGWNASEFAGAATVEGSGDLESWLPLETDMGPDGRGWFLDPAAVRSPARYYRLVVRPLNTDGRMPLRVPAGGP